VVAVWAEGLQSSGTWEGTKIFLGQNQANKIKEVVPRLGKIKTMLFDGIK
jgi:hypothetical protein